MIRAGKGDRFIDYSNTALMCIVLVVILYPLIFIISSSLSNPVAVNSGEVIFLP